MGISPVTNPKHPLKKPEYPATPRRSSLAEAYTWVSRIMSCSITMVLPGIAGYYLDAYFGTSMWNISGWIIGPILGFYQLLAITKESTQQQESQQSNKRELDK